MVVLPDTDADQADMFCKKLSRNLNTDAIFDPSEARKGLCFDVSAGIAQAQEDSQIDSLLSGVEKRQNNL